jgi:predicted neuraminidase
MFGINCNALMKGAGLGVACLAFGLAWYSHPPAPISDFQIFDPSTASQAVQLNAAPSYSSRFASSDLDDFVHAAAVSPLPGGDLMAVWFAGSREGAADVQIRGARYNAANGEWGDERVLATRDSTETAVNKHIRKLGNPIIALAPNDRLWLFYVSVSVGGWAGSAINAAYSDDLGESWSTPRQLVTTPFLNISTLVRGAPVFHADGSIGLPVYHEFLGKFAEYLYLNPEGAVTDKFRISRGKHSLQPSIVPLSPTNAVALLRYAGNGPRHVLASNTNDAGKTWSKPRAIDPRNPNSSLAAIASPDHGLLVAMNNLTNGRYRLSLYDTDSEMTLWQPVIELDQSPDPEGNPFTPEVYREIIGDKFMQSSGQKRRSSLEQYLEHLDQRVCSAYGCEFEYEYPYFIRGQDGLYHLVYSWNNSFVKHVSFNEAWLKEQLQ